MVQLLVVALLAETPQSHWLLSASLSAIRLTSFSIKACVKQSRIPRIGHQSDIQCLLIILSPTFTYQINEADAMHGSKAAKHPRQRTTNSCTECRRRKQKVG